MKTVLKHRFLKIWHRCRALWLGTSLTRAIERNQQAAHALDAVVKEMLEQ